MTTILDKAFDTDRYPPARKAMIDSQLRTSGVNAPFVLAAMGRLAREDFLPEDKRGFAYVDRAIPLPDGGALAAPVVQGKMLEEAVPTSEDRALVIDNGSGYLAALVKPMVADLAVESPETALTAKKGEFTLILIDGAVQHIPAALAKRLTDGGRLVTGLADRGVTRLARGVKANGSIALLPVADLGMPELPAFRAKEGWSF